MKTLTEFHGITLKLALARKKELDAEAKKNPPVKAPVEVEAAPAEAPAEPTEASAEPTEAAESAPAPTPAPVSAPASSYASDAVKQALGEQFKLEGEKLDRLLTVMEMVGNRVQDLRRVVVLQLAEGEHAPKGSIQADGLCFLAEYLAPPPGARKGGREEREGRGGKGRGGKRGRGGREERSAGGGRGGDRPGGRPAGVARRPDEAPRGPRPPSAPGRPLKLPVPITKKTDGAPSA